MERRELGRTGLEVSALGLGCGAVGGLMVRGSAADQERGIARAIEAGITFFDTAPAYGDGASETNLGRAFARLRPSVDVVVATKFRVSGEVDSIDREVEVSLDASLGRLRRARVDLFQLHNAVGSWPGEASLDPQVVIDRVAPALERQRSAGKIGRYGITAFGERGAVDAVIDSGAFDTAQVPFSMLNPSPARTMPPGFPGDDADGRLAKAAATGLGTICIRALAAGALSGSEWRHPIAMAGVDPMGTGPSYASDVAAARRFAALVDEGWASSLTEAALRFALGERGLSTVLVGVATVEQLEAAIAAAERGPLPPEAVGVIEAAWAEMAAAG